jgi:hypothetical protein
LSDWVDLYDAVLEIDVDGMWRWKRIDLDPRHT